jgi:hypothetical protein
MEPVLELHRIHKVLVLELHNRKAQELNYSIQDFPCDFSVGSGYPYDMGRLACRPRSTSCE